MKKKNQNFISIYILATMKCVLFTKKTKMSNVPIISYNSDSSDLVFLFLLCLQNYRFFGIGSYWNRSFHLIPLLRNLHFVRICLFLFNDSINLVYTIVIKWIQHDEMPFVLNQIYYHTKETHFWFYFSWSWFDVVPSYTDWYGIYIYICIDEMF